MEHTLVVEATESLADRVTQALRACSDETGEVPTAARFRVWRDSLAPEERALVPSMTAVVPMAFRTWPQARAAAGLEKNLVVGNRRGPDPTWTERDCVRWLLLWLDSNAGRSLRAYSAWANAMRERGHPAPSAPTVRLRLHRPWSEIVQYAIESGEEPHAL